jgi:hypothetical protein
MACKYAFYLPAFLLVVIHFIVLHPMIKHYWDKVSPFVTSITAKITRPLKSWASSQNEK